MGKGDEIVGKMWLREKLRARERERELGRENAWNKEIDWKIIKYKLCLFP